MVPTATEMVKLLLYFTNHDLDFSEILSKTNEYIMLCCILYETCFFSYSTIALTALLVVLEELRFFNFALGLKNLIIENGLAFDLDEVVACQAKMRAYLGEESIEQAAISPEAKVQTEVSDAK